VTTAIVWAARLFQLAIFALGGLTFLAARDSDWGFAVLYALIAVICYLALTFELMIEEEED
jgi:hypothetical protein